MEKAINSKDWKRPEPILKTKDIILRLRSEACHESINYKGTPYGDAFSLLVDALDRVHTLFNSKPRTSEEEIKAIKTVLSNSGIVPYLQIPEGLSISSQIKWCLDKISLPGVLDAIPPKKRGRPKKKILKYGIAPNVSD